MKEKDEVINEMLVDNDTSSEYEVSKKAMESYLKYPCYNKGWYIRENKLIRECDGYGLTADIITSIKKPINDFFESIGEEKLNLDGCEVIRYINEHKEKFCDEIYPYFKCFAMVYYFIGNMMPVKCSFSPGRYGADNWKYKIQRILDFYEFSDDKLEKDRSLFNKKGQNNKWPDWLINETNLDKNNFIKSNYLMDYFDDSEFKKVKAFISNDDQKNNIRLIFNKENKKENYDLMKKWLIRNTKIIIQRSYRILNNFDAQWDESHTKEVKEICEYIFYKSGIDEKEVKIYTLLLF